MSAPARTAARCPADELRASARVVALSGAAATSIATIIEVLPDPKDLPPGTLVVVPGELAGGRTLARSVLAVFGRNKPVARVLRCSALVARGYVDVGAAENEAHEDLAWGYVRAEATGSTGPC